MSKLDTRVKQLRKGIIQRLSNPEGIQEEEVDSLIFVVEERLKEKIRKASHYTGITGSYAGVPSSFIDPKEAEHDQG
jgi:hypothetical protein